MGCWSKQGTGGKPESHSVQITYCKEKLFSCFIQVSNFTRKGRFLQWSAELQWCSVTALVSADLQLSVRLLADILDIYNAGSSLYCCAECLPQIFHFGFSLYKSPKVCTCSFCVKNTISQALTWSEVMKSHWPQPRHSCLYSLMIKSRWKAFDVNMDFFVFVSLLSIVSIHWNEPGSGGSKKRQNCSEFCPDLVALTTCI